MQCQLDLDWSFLDVTGYHNAGFSNLYMEVPPFCIVLPENYISILSAMLKCCAIQMKFSVM